MWVTSGSSLIPVISAYWWRAARGELCPKPAARDHSRGNEEGLMVTSCIAHTAPKAADSGFLWLSVSRWERGTNRQRTTHREEKLLLQGRSQWYAVFVEAQIHFMFSQTTQRNLCLVWTYFQWKMLKRKKCKMWQKTFSDVKFPPRIKVLLGVTPTALHWLCTWIWAPTNHGGFIPRCCFVWRRQLQSQGHINLYLR